MPRHTANFRDPMGLVMRMLASGNRAAYGALFREALRLGAMPFDVILSLFEQRRLKTNVSSNYPVVLIVGAPRSGTTLVYQVLSHYLDVTYPQNIVGVFERSPVIASMLQHRLGMHSKPDFQNFYGQTTRLSGCNDAFSIWNRWLGSDRYCPSKCLTSEQAEDMRNFFSVWTNGFERPFLNKNNRNAFAIELLAKHLPCARFVVVKRNPLFVAQSLIVARQKVQGNKRAGWGLESSSTNRATESLDYVDAVCSQIETIDNEMTRQLDTVEHHRIVDITYEGFCESPQQSISSIASKFDGLRINPESDLSTLQPFRVSQDLLISAAEKQRIEQKLNITWESAAVH